MGFETPKTIRDVIENIQKNRYVLPAIQREFVWNPERIEKLFDSLMRGYPIGSFLFWEIEPSNIKNFQLYSFMGRYHQRDYKHNEQFAPISDTAVTAVLDGQQRLTALNIGLRGSYAEKIPYRHWNNNDAFPQRRLYLNLLATPSQEDELAFDFRMLKDADAVASDDVHWFKVGDVLKFKEASDPSNYILEHELTKSANNLLYKLWNVVCEKPIINYFLEKDQNLDRVLNIFIRVNTLGMQLSYSDMLLSIATAQWQELDARKEVNDLVDALNQEGEGFNFNKDFVLKGSLVLADLPSVKFKADNFNRDNMAKIEEQWKPIPDALLATADLLSTWGFSRDRLTSNNAVLPIAYYLYQIGCPKGFARGEQFKSQRYALRKWLDAALLKSFFRGGTDGVLTTVRKTIREVLNNSPKAGFPLEQIAAALKQPMDFDETELDELLNLQYGDKKTFIVLARLYPWIKFDQHFHIDHIHPRGRMRKKYLNQVGVPHDERYKWIDRVNELGNLQFLQGIRNQEKSNKPFEDWLLAHCETDESIAAYSETHHIPSATRLGLRDFPAFLEARRELLRTKLTKALDVGKEKKLAT